MQARLRRRRSKPPVVLGGKDHHRVLAVHGDALWSEFQCLPYDPTEMSLGILKLPSWKRVECQLCGLFSRGGIFPRFGSSTKPSSVQTSLTKKRVFPLRWKQRKFSAASSPAIPLQGRFFSSVKFRCGSNRGAVLARVSAEIFGTFGRQTKKFPC